VTAGLPWRGPGDGRPDLPLPPGKVPLRRNGNWRKRWRYLGAFSDELMVCAARVQIGPLSQTFWAIWDRERRELIERTRMTTPVIARGEVWTEVAEGEHTGKIDWAPERGGTLVRIEAAPKHDVAEPVRAFLHAGEGQWAEAVCATGEDDNYVWTRKRAVPVECDVRIGERRIRCEARGVEDESCGYYAHHTIWNWSAGVGTTTDGRDVAWNLVEGINDPERDSERAIWVGGQPSEPGASRFEGLEAIECDGARLEFSAEAERARDEQRFGVSSSYRQPFGTFSGSLPGGLELAEGLGVMEHHEARW
jgi:Protein of unknown function (DUF2804)